MTDDYGGVMNKSDTNGNTDDATVTVNLGNNSPVARDDTASATPGVPVTINIGAMLHP